MIKNILYRTLREEAGGEGGEGGAGGEGGEGESVGLLDGERNFSENWLETQPEEYRSTLGKYKSLDELGKAYYNLNQLMGKKSQAVIIPDEESSDDEKAAYRKALGVPDDVDGYGIAKPEDLPEGLEWSDEITKGYLEIMHKHNITPAAAQELMAMNLQNEQAHLEEIRNYEAVELEKQDKVLKDAWGAEYGANMEIAKRGAATLGFDLSEENPLYNNAQFIQAMAGVAKLVREDRLVSGDEIHGAHSGKYKAQDIMTNPQNPMYERYQNGDEDVARMVTGLLQQG